MYRALLISLAFHLAILISPESLWSDGGFAARNVEVPRVVLRMAGSTQTAGVAEVSAMVPKTVSGSGRQPSISSSRLPVPSVLPPISPSTVADFASNESVDHRMSQGGAAATPSISGEDEREYRLSVAREARKFKGFPPVVRERVWEGEVLIAVSMSLSSPWPDISLQRSSGVDEIDRHALNMMERAVKVAAIPAGLQGKHFRIVLPVEYRLAD